MYRAGAKSLRAPDYARRLVADHFDVASGRPTLDDEPSDAAIDC